MDITIKQLNRLIAFLDRTESESYPETPSTLHSQITGEVIRYLLDNYTPVAGSRVLDIGCGQGPALELFRTAGLDAVGITLNEEDVRICREKGFDVYKMDQSFLNFEEGSYDLIWARHVIEHSIFPLFTLCEFSRVLVAGGLMYLEVPAPETSCHHERNPNHYSLFSKAVWKDLISRADFKILEDADYKFSVTAGPDEYWGFFCCKN